MPKKAASVREYKLGMKGGRGVGKSALIVQFILSISIDIYDPTIEDAYRKQCLIDGETALLDVIDVSDHEEYRAMHEQCMRTCEGFLLVYSITSRNSFDEINTFYQQIRRVKDRDFPMVLIANKCDLDFERKVSSQEGHDLARQFQCPFIETWAKQDINVDEAFFNVVREIRRYNRGQETGRGDSYGALRTQGRGFGNTLETDETKESSGCCGCVLM